MISEKYKCIFVHMPKAAGTSIIDAFGMDWNTPTVRTARFLSFGSHAPKEEWDEYYEKYSDYFTFSVVRNPWDRFISGWKYIERLKEEGRRKRNIKEDKNENEKEIFLNLLTSIPYEYDSHDWIHLAMTQYEALNHNGEIFVDKIIRFENLQKEFDEVCDIINKPKTKLNHLNCTLRKHYKNYFTEQRHLDLFYERYKDDIEKFNYKF